MTDSFEQGNGANNQVDGINSPEHPLTSEDDAPTSNENSSKITLYFLQGSRAIRIAWLLEALALPYTLNFYERKPDGSVPKAFINDVGAGFGLAKAPVLKDGNLVMEESGAIVECVLPLASHKLQDGERHTQGNQVCHWRLSLSYSNGVDF